MPKLGKNENDSNFLIENAAEEMLNIIDYGNMIFFISKQFI